uniref:GRF-type domain-containing protein n=1 Tax=Nicotiana tabacum TaxID=4097 RepID=A0A1S4AYR7_TOBAC|nr:PREDICTED: uncharacterized protein LOC107802769 [Nicotiana tabacum]
MSQKSTTSRNGMEICHCGFNAPLTISWSSANPGRRFYGCKLGRGSCKYFRWHDDEMPDQAKGVIQGLLKRVERTEKIVVRLKWLFVVVVVLCDLVTVFLPLNFNPGGLNPMSMLVADVSLNVSADMTLSDDISGCKIQ